MRMRICVRECVDCRRPVPRFHFNAHTHTHQRNIILVATASISIMHIDFIVDIYIIVYWMKMDLMPSPFPPPPVSMPRTCKKGKKHTPPSVFPFRFLLNNYNFLGFGCGECGDSHLRGNHCESHEWLVSHTHTRSQANTTCTHIPKCE